MPLRPCRAVLVALAPLAACATRGPVAAFAPVPRPGVVAAIANGSVERPSIAHTIDLAPVRAASDRLVATTADRTLATVPALRLALDVEVSPYEAHERVTRYVDLFTGAGRERFVARLRRGARYDALIRGRLRAAGLPEDLTYLALVESGYDPHAVSRVSAVGMWQFMAETARLVGLRVDWWVDERRDPVRSTHAAVRNLRWLRQEFGSTFLAAAAYNGGPGRVARGLERLAAACDTVAGEMRFFSLVAAGQLPEETSNYVPQIIAASLVAGEPARYRLDVPPDEPFAYDSLTVPPLVPLAAVAEATGATREALLDLNPHLLRGMTPPGDSTRVRVPLGLANDFPTRLDAVPAPERRAFRAIAPRAGETLARLAERAGVPAAELRRYNPGLATVRTGKRKGTLRAGPPLRVPTAAVVAYARVATGDLGRGPGKLPPLRLGGRSLGKPLGKAAAPRRGAKVVKDGGG